jgi:hypothetical protein
LDDVGVQVDITISPPSDTSTKVFVPVDQLDSSRRDEVRDFAAAGGTVVVAGADALLHGLDPVGSPVSDVFGATDRSPACEELAEVDRVEHGAWAAMEVPPDATSCFPADGDDPAAWLVAVPRGEGTIVAIGSASPFTNGALDVADNAVLAAALLGPAPGDELVVIPRPEVGEGDTPLLELVPDGVWRALWLGLAAVVAGVWWRGRRLGHPVEERLPPVLPSAELARSVARLFQRSGDRGAAADRLRRDLRREVARSLGLPDTTPVERLAELVTARTAVDPDDARTALLDGPVPDDRALTALAAAVARVRADHRHPPGEPTAAPPAPTDPSIRRSS